MRDMIEQVALAIEATMFAPHEMPLDAELHAKYLETASAAIKAMDQRRFAADDRLRNRVAVLEMVIREEFWPSDCGDAANAMIVEGIHEKMSPLSQAKSLSND